MSEDQPRRCVVCGRRELDATELQTCVGCRRGVRNNLTAIERGYALLSNEIADKAGAATPPNAAGSPESDEQPIPGGDALVLLSGGSDGRSAAFALLRDQDASHLADEYPGDVPSVLADLAGYEDIWRIDRGQDAAGPATIMTVIAYLNRNLSWAAQHHPAFDEFADAVARMHRAIKQALGDADPGPRGAPCPYCGSRLIQRYTDPDPCPDVYDALGYDRTLSYGVWRPCDHDGDGHDQGGRREDWVCSNRHCGKVFDERQHTFAIWQARALLRQPAC